LHSGQQENHVRKILLAFLLLVTPAAADTVKVAGADVAIVLPAGYCELQPNDKSDARVLAAIRGMIEPIGNSLLSAAAECSVLPQWRNRKVSRLSNMTQYQSYTGETKEGTRKEADEAVAAVCNELRATGKKQMDDINPSVKARAAKVMEKIEYGKIEMVGVTGEEPGVCYVALLQKFRAEDKTDVVQLVTYATTLVKGRWVYFYLFNDYENADSVEKSLAMHRKNVRAFLTANGM
jgi:hypothetical protein